jgi:hypothetical protein
VRDQLMAGMFQMIRNHGSLETQIFIPKTKGQDRGEACLMQLSSGEVDYSRQIWPSYLIL